MRGPASPTARLVRRAVHWVLWSRRNATITGIGVIAALVLFTATSMVVGLAQARRVELAARSAPPAASGTASPSRTPNLLDVASDPTAAAPSTAVLPRTTPQQAATRFVRTFCRPGVPSPVWWSAVRPLLSATSQLAYLGTDPALVPCHGITGPARVDPVELENSVDVQVPTDAGPYRVELSRADPRQGWVVERAAPAPAAGG